MRTLQSTPPRQYCSPFQNLPASLNLTASKDIITSLWWSVTQMSVQSAGPGHWLIFTICQILCLMKRENITYHSRLVIRQPHRAAVFQNCMWYCSEWISHHYWKVNMNPSFYNDEKYILILNSLINNCDEKADQRLCLLIPFVLAWLQLLKAATLVFYGL